MSDENPIGPPRAARRWLVFLVAAATFVVALAFAARKAPEPDPVSTTAAVEPAVSSPGSDPVPVVVAPPPVEDTQEELADVAPAVPADAPGFDLVRVAPDGGTVVAGHAAPGSTVTIYADAAPLAEVEADRQGNFVAIFRAEPAEVPQTLTLGAAVDEGEEVASADAVVLLPESPAPDPVGTPVEEPAAAPVETLPEEIAGNADPAVAEDPVEEVAVAAIEPAAPPQVPGAVGPRPRVAATAILRSDGVEVADAGAPPVEPEAPRQVSLASISYAEDGEVMLAGLGTAGARLRAYVDDGFAEEGEVGGDGRWSLGLGDVGVGLYRLRIDQIEPGGEVASRVETPFQRDLPRGPLPRPGAPGERPVQVTVQPGTNLWTLARVHYGAGVLYSQIFTANQHLIRDPDLIYPGQIFDLPEVDAAP